MQTGLAVPFPTSLYARIASRLGLALKQFINVGAGVVNADYHGEVRGVLINHGDQDFEVKMGDRIAQLRLEKINTLPVEEVQGLEDIVHGVGGFGSIGVNRQNDIDEKKELKDENE